MKFQITRTYWSSLPPIEIEIGAEFESSSSEIKLGAAVKVAFRSGADLSGADLFDAELRYADLRYANLSGADLSGADLWYANLSDANLSGAVLRYANLRGADLRGADLSGADLRCADLSGANLSDANLSGAVLRYADLSGAVLRCANLRGADLRYADLNGAVLRGADLRYANLSDVPKIEDLDAKIVAAIECGGKLDMNQWHTCETTHCRAGWAITLAGEDGIALEKKFGSAAAGALIYAKSTPDAKIPNFYASTKEAMEDLLKRAGR